MVDSGPVRFIQDQDRLLDFPRLWRHCYSHSALGSTERSPFNAENTVNNFPVATKWESGGMGKLAFLKLLFLEVASLLISLVLGFVFSFMRVIRAVSQI